MRPKRNVASKYQRNEKENGVESVSFTSKTIAGLNQQTRPRRQALADKTNSVADDKINSECKHLKNNKPSIMDSKRPKRQVKLPARLNDKSMEIPSMFRNAEKPSGTSTPVKPKVPKTQKKIPLTKTVCVNEKAADSNNNPDSISNLTKVLRQKSITSKENINQAPKLAVTTPTISITKVLPIIETEIIFKEPTNTSSKQDIIAKNVDVYEFEFDPSEEPVIKKKKKPVQKRKRIVKDKMASAFFVKENYNKKMDKKLEELKKMIASKTVSKVAVPKSTIRDAAPLKKVESKTKPPVVLSDVHNKEHLVIENEQPRPYSPEFMQDFQFHDNDALRAEKPITANVSGHDQTNRGNQVIKSTYPMSSANTNVTYSNTSNRSDLSFLEEMPVACSSFNVSQVKKQPSGSPWRANFEIEPKRWPVNFYVKPGSLTPAYESTFHSVDLISDKSNVYAPLPTQTANTTQATLRTPEKDNSQLKQSSILSFFEEVMAKSASKQMKKSKLTPQKFDLFYDAPENSIKDLVTKRKAVMKSILTTPTKLSLSSASTSTSPKGLFENSSNLDSHTAQVTESTSKEITALRNITFLSNSPDKYHGKENKDNLETSADKRKRELKDKCFGFDDSDEDNDQENVSPKDINVNRMRGGAYNIGMRKRGALKEVNIQRGPMRVNVPLKPTLVHPENMPEKIVDLMSQLDAVKAQKKTLKHINESSSDSSEGMQMKEPELQLSTSQMEDLPLFTDIDFVHYNKPERRSYGKAKAATAKRVRSTSSDHEHAGSDLDLSAESNVNVTKRKTTKKRKVNAFSKKEVQEADEWVAGFNSMVEEVDEFSLVVE